MAKNRNAYREKTNPALTVLYIIVVLALTVAIVFMYMNWHKRMASFEAVVQEASESERAFELEARQRDEEELEEELEEEPTEAPTEAPTATPEPTEAPTEAPEPTVEVALPGVNEAELEDLPFQESGFGNDPVAQDERADDSDGDIF